MKFAVLDFETTGSQAHDSVIQVGVAVVENGSLREVYGSLVHTKQRIPDDIRKLTGISNEQLVDAPSLHAVMSTIEPMLDGAILVAHNAGFDVGFLQRSRERCKMPRFAGRIVDSVELTRICFPTLSGLSLGMLAHHFGIVHDRPHQADSDAAATAELLLICLQRVRTWPLLVLQRIDDVLRRFTHSDLAWFFQQIRQEREREVAIDTQSHRYFRRFSMAVGNWGESEREAQTADHVSLPATVNKETFALFYQTLKDRFAATFANYENRPSQEEMINAVFESLHEQQHLLVEAGTGTGKSLAYLIATLFFGLIREEKIVVSTHTINLMEQLVSQDVPLLQQLWPGSFRAAIVKGRSHYLCLRKFEQTINGEEFVAANEMFITAAQMIVWLNETQTGDDEELQLLQKGRDFWKLVESDSQSCLNRACPWYKKCFYHRSRNDAAAADLIITNHSLVFSDLQTDNRLLPPYQHLVVDEAHHFETAASKHFGIELNFFSVLNPLTRLYRDQRSGQLPLFRNRLQPFADADVVALRPFIEAMMQNCVEMKENWEQVCELMFLTLREIGAKNDSEAEQQVVRLIPGEAPADWERLCLPVEQVIHACTELMKQFTKLENGLRASEYEAEFQGALIDLGGTIASVQRLRDAIAFFFALAQTDYVYWMEASGKGQKSIHFHAAPIEVSGLLRDQFFGQKESVIMTSATLAVDRSFQHVAEQLGLQDAMRDGRVRTVQLSSPFQYKQQALVCIPNDFPAIASNQQDESFLTALVRSLTDVAEVTGGRMLVLFTSNRMLRQVHERMQAGCTRLGIQLLGQNVTSTSRTKLIRMFRQHRRSVLLGTSSFWEGVDIPGDALSCLAIVRLPFQPPNQPLFAAKSELFKKQNRNSFMQLAVPQAVIRFKQGFGRLIRSTSDRGIVLVYDTRVIETRYGSHFLRSLPEPRIEQMQTAFIPTRIRQWLLDSKTSGGVDREKSENI